ncbi:MAG: hypothetical protein HRU03_01120 [Nanoarchaeales archaeon]|nr:hypothetical protein [Nanoarchaeales archaeon]
MDDEKRFQVANLFRFPGKIIENYKIGDIQFDLDRYSVQLEKFNSFNWNSIGDNKFPSKIFADAKDGLVLYYEDIAVAVIFFKKQFLRNKIDVTQIQSFEINKSTDEKVEFTTDNFYINGFKWGNVLIKLLENYFILKKYDEIIIHSTNNNIWEKMHRTDRGYDRYDKVALDMGYIRNYDSNYTKSLK